MGFVLSLLLKPKVAGALIIVVLLLSVWAMFRHQESQLAHAREELAAAHQMLAAAQAQLAVNDHAHAEARRTESVNQTTRTIEAEATQEIANAVTDQNAHVLYVAWITNVNRLRNAERAEGLS